MEEQVCQCQVVPVLASEPVEHICPLDLYRPAERGDLRQNLFRNDRLKIEQGQFGFGRSRCHLSDNCERGETVTAAEFDDAPRPERDMCPKRPDHDPPLPHDAVDTPQIAPRCTRLGCVGRETVQQFRMNGAMEEFAAHAAIPNVIVSAVSPGPKAIPHPFAPGSGFSSIFSRTDITVAPRRRDRHRLLLLGRR